MIIIAITNISKLPLKKCRYASSPGTSNKQIENFNYYTHFEVCTINMKYLGTYVLLTVQILFFYNTEVKQTDH